MLKLKDFVEVYLEPLGEAEEKVEGGVSIQSVLFVAAGQICGW